MNGYSPNIFEYSTPYVMTKLGRLPGGDDGVSSNAASGEELRERDRGRDLESGQEGGDYSEGNIAPIRMLNPDTAGDPWSGEEEEEEWREDDWPWEEKEEEYLGDGCDSDPNEIGKDLYRRLDEWERDDLPSNYKLCRECRHFWGRIETEYTQLLIEEDLKHAHWCMAAKQNREVKCLECQGRTQQYWLRFPFGIPGNLGKPARMHEGGMEDGCT